MLVTHIKNLLLIDYKLPDRTICKLVGNILILLIGAFVAQFLNFGSLLLVARYLEVDAYGQYTAILTLLTQSAIILNFGMDTWLLREGGRLDETSFVINTSNSLLLKLMFTGPWVVIVVLIAPYLNPDVYVTSVIGIASFGMALHVANILVQAAFKSQIRNHITVPLQITNALLFFISTLYLIQGDSSLFDFMQARTLAIMVMFIISLLVFYQAYGFKIQVSSMLTSHKNSISFFAIDMLSYIYAMADVTIIAIWLGKTAVGIYSPAIVLINAIYIVLNAIQGAVLPVLSRIYLTNKTAIRIPSILLIISLLVVGVIISVVIRLLAPFIISLLYGGEFRESAYILALLSPVLLFKSVNFAFGIILIAVNAQNNRIFVQSIIAIINVSLNILFITQYGLTGVIYIFILTEFGLFLGYSGFVVYRLSQVSSSLKKGKSLVCPIK